MVYAQPCVAVEAQKRARLNSTVGSTTPTEMAKRKFKIQFRIPPYVTPRNDWRRLIYKAARTEMRARQVTYQCDDKLAVEVVLYLDGAAICIHDVDNRLKDVLDALQGRMGGPKTVRRHQPLIPNDNQIFRVAVTKMQPPPQSHGLGHVTITKHRKYDRAA